MDQQLLSRVVSNAATPSSPSPSSPSSPSSSSSSPPSSSPPSPHEPVTAAKYLQFLGVPFAVPYAVGMLGNLTALCVLYRTRRDGNRKHAFMLRCLIAGDAVALNGLLVMFFVQKFRPGHAATVWTCRLRVLLRFFSTGSGCVVTTAMAVERWLALTKPFFYHRYVDLSLLKKLMFSLWLGVLGLACAPFFGFGIYWDEKSSECVRYRNANKLLDVAYIYVYFGYGLIQCVAIAYMNLSVMRTLCVKISPINRHTATTTTTRRVSRREAEPCTAATSREKSFGWLMLLLCVSFIICWVPHVILIPLNRFVDDDNKMRPFNVMADMLIVIHFTLDPYLYVLQHWKLVKSIFQRPAKEENTKYIVTMSRSSSSKKSSDAIVQLSA